MTNNSKYVFIDHNFVVGDGDDYIEGFAIMERSAWETQVQKYIDCVNDNFEVKDPKEARIELETSSGFFEVTLSNYNVKPCTEEELKIFYNFFGESYSYQKEQGIMCSRGRFREPSYWIEYMVEPYILPC